MDEIINGTVTIPLKDYHRLLECENILWKLRKEPTTIIFHYGPYYNEQWAVLNADDAIKSITEKANVEIKRLQDRFISVTMK